MMSACLVNDFKVMKCVIASSNYFLIRNQNDKTNKNINTVNIIMYSIERDNLESVRGGYGELNNKNLTRKKINVHLILSSHQI